MASDICDCMDSACPYCGNVFSILDEGPEEREGEDEDEDHDEIFERINDAMYVGAGIHPLLENTIWESGIDIYELEPFAGGGVFQMTRGHAQPLPCVLHPDDALSSFSPLNLLISGTEEMPLASFVLNVEVSAQSTRVGIFILELSQEEEFFSKVTYRGGSVGREQNVFLHTVYSKHLVGPMLLKYPVQKGGTRRLDLVSEEAPFCASTRSSVLILCLLEGQSDPHLEAERLRRGYSLQGRRNTDTQVELLSDLRQAPRCWLSKLAQEYEDVLYDAFDESSGKTFYEIQGMLAWCEEPSHWLNIDLVDMASVLAQESCGEVSLALDYRLAPEIPHVTQLLRVRGKDPRVPPPPEPADWI